MTTKKIRTEAELRHYLTKRYWDVLIIDEGINLNDQVIINRDVKLICSNKGAIFSLHTDTGDNHSVFLVEDANVEFESMNIRMIPNMAGKSSAIKFDAPLYDGIVSGCIITGFSWGAIWQFDCDSVIVHNNRIEGDSGTSYNYAVWQGGSGDAYGQGLHLINNNISKVRHAIGSSYHPNSYYAVGNTISTIKHPFDRHNWNDGGRKGGLHTHIIGNTFLDPDRLAFSIEPPYEGGSFSFIGNTLNHSKERWIGEVSDERVWEGRMPEWYNAQGNKFKTI